MKPKNERQCWFCGGRDLETDSRGVRCRNCGSTWNVLPDVAGPTTVLDNITVGSESNPISVRAAHPSPGVTRRAARARSRK